MTRHVVFGTGQVGRLVAEQLSHRGVEVVAVNRNGQGEIPGARVVGGDATDPAFTTRAAAGAEVVYFCLNAMHYARWTEEFPPLQRAVVAAQAVGARLVVLDNLYAYGPPGGRDLVESMAARPTSAKAATRAAMTAELLDGQRAGRLEVAVGRASDYFGPGTTRSALGESVFGAALAGRTAQVMGDPDQPHSYSFTPDVAAGLITLATHPAAGRATLRLAGVAKPALREYLHTLYQFTDRWVVDDIRFRDAFGDQATPLDDALATTLRWYRDRTASHQAA